MCRPTHVWPTLIGLEVNLRVPYGKVISLKSHQVVDHCVWEEWRMEMVSSDVSL